VQQVPMMGVTSAPKLAFNAGGKATPLNFPGDFVAFSPHAERDIRIDNSELSSSVMACRAGVRLG